MSITNAQSAPAQQTQLYAAQDPGPAIRLIAGPGTGKSAAIERRVAHVLNAGAPPNEVFVISFTRATCSELTSRIAAHCANQPCSASSGQVRVSTMHALGLRILRSAAVLSTLYPADPSVMDDWEQANIYDEELAATLGCLPTRAGQIRAAHDAQWQTLNAGAIGQAAITATEQAGFTAFHSTRRNLYCCVLPGEVIFECVTRIQQNAIQQSQLPTMSHLIVDEYQDLNACDQEFIRLLTRGGATLFIAGDDDQSIYSFRHANPNGIIQFNNMFPGASTHTLSDCFRCTPAVVTSAMNLIAHNPNRLPKQLTSLYSHATPPVQGSIRVWSFTTATAEAAAIAQSCQQLINTGMSGQEDQIVILISNRRLQLPIISRELANLGLPFDAPAGESLRDQDGIRAVYSILRIVRDLTVQPDYLCYRALLGQLHGVGVQTAKSVGDLCVNNHQNFRALFHTNTAPIWLTNRARTAVGRIQTIAQQVSTWTLQDTVTARTNDVTTILSAMVFGPGSTAPAEWSNFAGTLPSTMTLAELLGLLASNDDAEQRQILEAINLRAGVDAATQQPQGKRVRILTMHGAKGLSGHVVFIPSAEQGIMPNFRAIQAVGLLNEQRRLFYVSLTRAKAACIITHAGVHSPPESFLIGQQPTVRLTRSQFVTEMNIASVNRTQGLTATEATQIVTDIGNL